MFAVLNKIPTFVLEDHILTSAASHTASSDIAEFPERAHSFVFVVFNLGGSVSPFLYTNTRTNMKTTNVCKGAKYSNTCANLILTRDAIHGINETRIEYSLGWGDGRLHGNPLTYSELWGLHRLIERVLREDAHQRPSARPFRGVESTTYRHGHHTRTQRLFYSCGDLIPEPTIN